MRSTTKRIATVTAIATAGVAIGGTLATAQNSATQPAVAVCELVTKAEAVAALGDAVVVTDGGRACSYTVTKSGAFKSLTVSLGPGDVKADTFAEGMRAYAQMANLTLRAAADTGDEAWAALGDQLSQLMARRGERAVSVVLINVRTPVDERVATMAALARKALARLG